MNEWWAQHNTRKWSLNMHLNCWCFVHCCWAHCDAKKPKQNKYEMKMSWWVEKRTVTSSNNRKTRTKAFHFDLMQRSFCKTLKSNRERNFIILLRMCCFFILQSAATINNERKCMIQSEYNIFSGISLVLLSFTILTATRIHRSPYSICQSWIVGQWTLNTQKYIRTVVVEQWGKK